MMNSMNPDGDRKLFYDATIAHQAPLLCPWDSPGKNTGVGCHAVLQGIFPTQGSNPGLPHYRQIPYYLSHQGSPWYRVHKDKSSTLSGSISDGHHYHRMPGGENQKCPSIVQ